MALIHTGTVNMTMPSGTTVQRPASPTIGMMRYNTDYSLFEYYNGSTWKLMRL